MAASSTPTVAAVSRLDSHLLIILAILLTAAALAVLLGRSAAVEEEIAIASACGFALLALVGHLAISWTGRAPEPAKLKSRGNAAKAKKKLAAQTVEPADDRREPVLPALGSEPSLDTAVDIAALAALPTVTSPATSAVETSAAGTAALGSWQAEISRAMPPVDSHGPAEPRLPDPHRSEPPALPPLNAVNPAAPNRRPGSTIDENEVQRVEKLVRQLAENVSILEQSAPTTGRGQAGRVTPQHGQPPQPPPAATLQNPYATGPSIRTAIPTVIASMPSHQAVAAQPTLTEPSLHELSAPEQSAPDVSSYDAASTQMAVALAAALAPEPAEPATAARPSAATTRERDEIIAALNAQRIDVFLEPILDIKDQRPQHFEVSIAMRTASGAALDLGRAETHLGGTGLLPLLDQTRIVQAANLADRLAGLGKTGSVLTRLHGETLSNEGFRHSFASGQRTIGAFPRHLVLSLPQVEVAHFTNADWQTLARLGAAGFGFAITSITTLDMDFQGLAARGFVIARLDADTFLNGLPAEGMRIPPGDICRHFAACELALVVGRIDDDQQLARIFGFGVLFGQGQVFGGPRAVNPDAHVRGGATTGSVAATA